MPFELSDLLMILRCCNFVVALSKMFPILDTSLCLFLLLLFFIFLVKTEGGGGEINAVEAIAFVSIVDQVFEQLAV